MTTTCVSPLSEAVANIIPVATIADLRALEAPDETVKVDVLGYYSAGDGGGGEFYWDASSTATDNGGTVIAANAGGTGRWRWPDTSVINVKRFGAKGDGVTDDTAAIDAAIAAGGVIYVPKSSDSYLVDSLDALNSGTTFVGDGRGKTIIKQRTADQCLFQATDKTDISFFDIEFDGQSLGNVATAGGNTSLTNKFANFTRCARITVRRCYIHSFTNQGINFELSTGGTSDIRILDSEIANIGARNTTLNTPYAAVPNTGAWLPISFATSGAQDVALASNVYIQRNKIHGSWNTLVSIANTDLYWIEDNEIYDTDSNTIQAGQRSRYGRVLNNYLHGFTGLYAPTTEGRGISVGQSTGNETGFVFSGNRIVDAANYGIEALAATDVVVAHNIIVNNARTSGQQRAAILARGDRVVIVHNEIVNPNYEGILRDDGDDGVIGGNIITTPGNGGIKANSATATQRRTKIVGNSVSSGLVEGIVANVDEAVIHGNTVKDCNQSAAANIYGIALFGTDMSGIVAGNIVNGANHTFGINLNTQITVKVVRVHDNVVETYGTGAIRDQGGVAKIRQNQGYVTEAGGTGTINSGATTATITHGLSKTPTAKNIGVVFTEQGTNDYGRWWISGITSTQFVVNVSADPGASNLDFSWQAAIL